MLSFGRVLSSVLRTSNGSRSARVLQIAKPVTVETKRFLSLHEYRSFELLNQYGVTIPRGNVAQTPIEAEAIAESLNTEDLVLKAQVLAGGRGKGHFDNGLKGGVRIVFSPTEVRMFAEKMLGHNLITKQTGAAGRVCNHVYICERLFARREYYFAITMDRKSQGPVLIGSSQGGMDIETVAAENPASIVTESININQGLSFEKAAEFAKKLGFGAAYVPSAAENMVKLYNLFIEKDATLVEINPLSEVGNGKVVCMDAKLNFDDNADFRQKEVFKMRDPSQEDELK